MNINYILKSPYYVLPKTSRCVLWNYALTKMCEGKVGQNAICLPISILCIFQISGWAHGNPQKFVFPSFSDS